MSGIIGVWTKSADDALPTAELMLTSLIHRGSLRRIQSLDDIQTHHMAVGCASSSDLERGAARSPTTLTALNGSFYERRNSGSAEYVLRRIDALTCRRALMELSREVGGFAGLVAQGNALYAFRDVNGLKPLYYARSSGVVAFASEKKALWTIGLEHPSAVLPGSIVKITDGKLTVQRTVRFHRPREKRISLERATATLHRLLNISVRRITRNAGKICVAFSGGLDSAVTAATAKNLGVRAHAISVGLRGSPELSDVERLANQLGLDITVEQFDTDSIEEYVRRVLWLIEEPNLMKLSVAIPLHWAAKVASRDGYGVMLCGQGSDELYGGYAKYAHTLKTKGRRALTAQLFRSVVESSQVNYERDDQATSTFPVELRTPFADPDLIRFSLTIPSEFKVKSADDVTRKWVLREVALRAGVPEEMAWRRKKAIQHGTGVEKAIIKLAKGRGQQPDDYLSQMFAVVRDLDTMP